MENFGSFLFKFGINIRKTIRLIESTDKKLINAELALLFNETCKNENILPRYTDINPHDPAARQERFTVEYRFKLIERQISLKMQQINEIKSDLAQKYNDVKNITTTEEFLEICMKLKDVHDQHFSGEKRKIIRKLNNLASRSIFIREKSDCFLNLSNYELSNVEKEVLNLGLNCHLQSKFDPVDKRVEIEMLYTSLVKLKNDDKIDININLKEELRAESTRRRSNQNSSLLSSDHKLALKSLKNNDNIMIRKADKSNIYVILNKTEYIQKIDDILQDNTKFRKISSDPTAKIKTEVNRLITESNRTSSSVDKLDKIIGEFEPGYIYGNVKTHKTDNPLRPSHKFLLQPS